MALNRQRRRAARRIRWGNVEQRVIRARLALRCLWLVRGLKLRSQAVKAPRLYIGDVRLARLIGCSESSILRAKKDLETLHLVAVMHTVGGCTHNPEGKVVAAATGYEPHPDLYELTNEQRQGRTPAPAAAERMRGLHQRWEESRAAARAGP